jgi:hypothetical protein
MQRFHPFRGVMILRPCRLALNPLFQDKGCDSRRLAASAHPLSKLVLGYRWGVEPNYQKYTGRLNGPPQAVLKRT